MTHEIQKMLVLSTIHLREHTLTQMDGGWLDAVAYPNEHGAFVLADFEPTVANFAGCPADLMACYALATKLGCTWIKFDRDARTAQELPMYE